MISNFDRCLDLVLAHEGGFTADKRDNGNKLPDGRQGSTMMGVTQYNWELYVGHKVTHDDMKKLTRANVYPFYKKLYWDAVRADELATGVDYIAFDFAVNAGPLKSRAMIQQAIGVYADGIWGPITMKALKDTPAKDIINKFSHVKEVWYRSLEKFPIYGQGWLRRVRESQDAALKML